MCKLLGGTLDVVVCEVTIYSVASRWVLYECLIHVEYSRVIAYEYSCTTIVTPCADIL